MLLVKHRYGHTKGRLDFPRGYARPYEPLEEAVVREVCEETAVVTNPVRIVALRNQLRTDEGKSIRNDLLVVWLLEYLSGDPTPDGKETSEAKFLDTDAVLRAQDVGDWTKDLLGAVRDRSGLCVSEYQSQHLPDDCTYWKCFT